MTNLEVIEKFNILKFRICIRTLALTFLISSLFTCEWFSLTKINESILIKIGIFRYCEESDCFWYPNNIYVILLWQIFSIISVMCLANYFLNYFFKKSKPIFVETSGNIFSIFLIFFLVLTQVIFILFKYSKIRIILPDKNILEYNKFHRKTILLDNKYQNKISKRHKKDVISDNEVIVDKSCNEIAGLTQSECLLQRGFPYSREGVPGLPGPQGPVGIPGLPGESGILVHEVDIENADIKIIGNNPCINLPGIGYIEKKTLLSFFKNTQRGPPGQPGPPGLPGRDGSPGEMGDSGHPGFNGRPGEDGDRGDFGQVGGTGSSGHPGISGDIGNIGPPGDDGVPGTRGEPGTPGTIYEPCPPETGQDKPPLDTCYAYQPMPCVQTDPCSQAPCLKDPNIPLGGCDTKIPYDPNLCGTISTGQNPCQIVPRGPNPCQIVPTGPNPCQSVQQGPCQIYQPVSVGGFPTSADDRIPQIPTVVSTVNINQSVVLDVNGNPIPTYDKPTLLGPDLKPLPDDFQQIYPSSGSIPQGGWTVDTRVNGTSLGGQQNSCYRLTPLRCPFGTPVHFPAIPCQNLQQTFNSGGCQPNIYSQQPCQVPDLCSQNPYLQQLPQRNIRSTNNSKINKRNILSDNHIKDEQNTVKNSQNHLTTIHDTTSDQKSLNDGYLSVHYSSTLPGANFGFLYSFMIIEIFIKIYEIIF